MTDLRKLLSEATEGPWAVKPHMMIDDVHMIWVVDQWVSVGSSNPKDAALICAMRNEIEGLLDFVGAAQALVEEWGLKKHTSFGAYQRCSDQLQSAIKETESWN